MNILIRVIIAIVVVVILFAILGPVLNIFELPKSSDLERIIKVVIGGVALLYIVAGDRVELV